MKKITMIFTLFAFSFLGFAQSGGDTCGDALEITGNTSFTGVLITQDSAGAEMGEGDSTFYTFTAPSDGTIVLESCDSGLDTRVHIGTGDCGTLTNLDSDDDGCTGLTSIISIAATNGTTYTIEWDDRWSTAAFDWNFQFITCTAPTVDTLTIVDDCDNNQFTIEVPVLDMGNSAQITISNDAGVAATVVNMAETAIAGPFPAGTPVNLVIEHENDADCNLTGGPFADSCPPANDECAAPIAVNCDDTVGGSTAGATDSGGNSNAANDVWFSYTGSGAAEDVTLSLCGSGYDTLIRVYDDCSVTAEAQVAANDDSCGVQSVVTFASDGSTTYNIMVEGFGTSSGAFTLEVTCATNVPAPANDECANAIPLALDTPENGTTAGATDDSTGNVDDTTCESFSFKSDVWYTFVAPADGSVGIQTTITGTSDQANVAVYSSTDCSQLDADSLYCESDGAGENFEATGLTSGNTYYIRVWSDGVAPPPPTNGRIEGEFVILVSDAALSTTSFESNEFEYYPNPVKNTLTFNAQNEIKNISVFNILGQQVLKVAPNALTSNLDMSSLQDGAYFVEVSINGVTETVRVIKN